MDLRKKICFIFFTCILNIIANNTTLYEEHRSFSTFLMPHTIKELSKYLPNDLISEDLEKIHNFVNNLNINPNTIIHFKFYRQDHCTKLIGIYCETQEVINVKKPHIEEQNKKKNIIVNSSMLGRNETQEVINVKKPHIEEQNKKKNIIVNSSMLGRKKQVKGKKYSIISISMNHLLEEIDAPEEKVPNKKIIEDILKIINLSLENNLNEKISIEIVYDITNDKKEIICIQLIDKNKKKENFYIFNMMNDRILIINEKGYLVPGKLLSINNKLPVCNGILGSPFGYRLHPILKKKKFHTGQDIKIAAGSEIFAMAEGTVLFANYNRYYGYVVLIYHSNKMGEGYSTLYAHCSKLIVNVGQRVGKGELIAYVGSTGRSTGPHLHFEVIDNKSKKRLNPKNTFILSQCYIPTFFIPQFLLRKKEIAEILK